MILTERTRVVRVMGAVAAGTSNQNGSSVDMSQGGGFRGCRFTALIGALTGSQTTSLKIQGSSDNSNWSDLAGTGTGDMADADTNTMLIADIYRPKHRYNRAVVVRGTANAVIDGVTAELYEPITSPTTQLTSTSAPYGVSKSSSTVTPVAGTA